MTRIFLILSGIPGTGKSTYSRWLTENHGFTHFDIDWSSSPTDDELVSDRLVVDWGFPANEPGITQSLEVIRSWQQLGAELWWFDGDRDSALESFLKRGTVGKEAWDYQLQGIATNWFRILEVTEGRQIDAIGLEGHKTAEGIFGEMFPEGIDQDITASNRTRGSE